MLKLEIIIKAWNKQRIWFVSEGRWKKRKKEDEQSKEKRQERIRKEVGENNFTFWHRIASKTIHGKREYNVG